MAVPKKQSNLTAVASAAGVSISTASLALRGDRRVLPATMQKVRRAARRLKYQPNALVAQLMAQLRSSRAPHFQATLALVNASSREHFFQLNHTFASWAAGARARAAQQGYSVDDFWLQAPGITPRFLQSIFQARNIRGVLIACEQGSTRLPPKFSFLWDHFPSAALGVVSTRPRLHTARSDQYACALEATRRVLAAGYRRPALVTFPEVEIAVEHAFTAGFLMACREAPGVAEPLIFCQPRPSVHSTTFLAWFQEHRPDAILSIDGSIPAWLESAGIRVPVEVAFVMLDWHPGLPGVAGIDQNATAVGAAGTDLVIAQIHRSEKGCLALPKCVLIANIWRPGVSMRIVPRRDRLKISSNLSMKSLECGL